LVVLYVHTVFAMPHAVSTSCIASLPSVSLAGDVALSMLAPQLAQRVWRGQACGAAPLSVVPTGHAGLDGHLPGGGWPRQSVTEVLQIQDGVAEWRLLLPALAPLLAPSPTFRRAIVAIGCPHEPFLPGLQQAGVKPRQLVWVRTDTVAQSLWATEQAIKSLGPAAVLAWLPHARPEQIRRLQVHALEGDAPVFLMRPATAQYESSAAPLRVLVEPAVPLPVGQLAVRILKRRGAAHEGVIVLRAMPSRLGAVVPAARMSRFSLARDGAQHASVEQSHAALAGASTRTVDVAGRGR
jgi:protein ImuA